MAKTPVQIQDLTDTLATANLDRVLTSLISVPNTTIVNRAQIPDLANDLGVRMGVERIQAQQIYEIQGESGPNGERVWGEVNDTLGLIRLVGNWANTVNNYGPRPLSSASGDYVEVTFYGTGLNLLHYAGSAARDYRVSVDGGAEGSNVYITASDILGARNTRVNHVLGIVTGLSLGLHTVKIRNNSANNMNFYGVEILNDSSSIKIQPGSILKSGVKQSLAAQATSAYNSSFESGVLGTRGGRALVYLKSDGTVGKSLTPTNSAAAYLTSADHTNESVIAQHYAREFGAGRADDFSLLPGTAANKALTLDDGTSTLVGSNVRIGALGSESISVVGSGYLTLTFVGTGLDVLLATDGTTRSFTAVYVDGGASIGTVSKTGSTAMEIRKIVSGLPYGTHTIKFENTSGGVDSPAIAALKVYGPKKPSLPTGAVELAEYYILADYASANAGLDTVSAGTLRKHNTREFTYVGTWTMSSLATNEIGFFQAYSTTNSDYLEYTFFGTGFDWRFSNQAVTATWQMTLTDAANPSGTTNLSGYTTSSNGTGITSWTASTGTLVTAASAATGNRVTVSGLAMGWHKIRLTKTAGTGQVYHQTFDLITPIHFPKLNGPVVLQNTLRVGSQGIGDSRVLAAGSSQASIARGVANSPTTTSTSAIPLNEMATSLSVKKAERYRISFTMTISSSVNSPVVNVYIDGQRVDPQISGGYLDQGVGSQQTILSIQASVLLSQGDHLVSIYWYTGGATIIAVNDYRVLSIERAA